MRAAHEAVASNQERRRKRKQIDGLRHERVHVVRLAGHEHRVVDVVLLHERAQPDGVRQLIGLLERERDDLQTARFVGAIEVGEERRFVVAVGAPAAADHDDHDLAGEAAVCVRDQPTLEIREAETQRLRRIGDAREARGIGRLRQARRARIVGSHGDEPHLAARVDRRRRRRHTGHDRRVRRGRRGLYSRGRQPFLNDLQRAVCLQFQLEQRGTGAREMTQRERAIFVCAGQRSRIAVHTQNGG